MAGATGNLVHWKPGQSGNPSGHSKARRQAKRLREALDVMLEQEIPAELLERIDEKTRDALPDGVTFSEIIALRVAMVAATAKRPSDTLSAASIILGAQAKPDPNQFQPTPEAPRLPTTEERRQAVARQLGVELEGETDG